MNRRTFLKAVPAMGLLGVTNVSFSEDANTAKPIAEADKVSLEADGVIKLNPPDLNGGISLMQALKKRKSRVWGYRYPDFMDALLPLASLPIEIAGRNRILRKMIIDAIKEDPTWNNGNYVQQPAVGLKHALDILMIMSSVPLQWQKDAPTKSTAELFLDKYLSNAAKGKDANDMIYQFDASRVYNPAPYLQNIKAPLLAINSADDQINPPELKVLDTAIVKVAKGKYILLPISSETRGHGTHSLPKIWGNYLREFMKETERK